MTVLSGVRRFLGLQRSETKGGSIERVRLSNGTEEAGMAAAELASDAGGPGGLCPVSTVVPWLLFHSKTTISRHQIAGVAPAEAEFEGTNVGAKHVENISCSKSND